MFAAHQNAHCSRHGGSETQRVIVGSMQPPSPSPSRRLAASPSGRFPRFLNAASQRVRSLRFVSGRFPTSSKREGADSSKFGSDFGAGGVDLGAKVVFRSGRSERLVDGPSVVSGGI